MIASRIAQARLDGSLGINADEFGTDRAGVLARLHAAGDLDVDTATANPVPIGDGRGSQRPFSPRGCAAPRSWWHRLVAFGASLGH